MCFHENFGCFFGPTAPLLSSRVPLVWLEVSLFVSESGFSFLEWRVHPPLCHGDTREAVFNRAG